MEFTQVRKSCKFYILIFLLSIMVGLIYLMPHFLRAHFLAEEGLKYHPLSFTAYYDEANNTGAHMHEILDGHFRVSDTDIYENIGVPSLWPTLPQWLLAPLLLLTKSVTQTMIISHFLFTAIFFWIFYALGYFLLHRKRWLAVFFSLVMSLFTWAALFFPPVTYDKFRRLVSGFLPFQYRFWKDRLTLPWIESFIPDFLIFGPGILFLLLALIKDKIKYYILAGVFFGLMFYTYFYHWVYFTVVLAILVFLFLLKKDFATVKRLLLTIFTGAIISSYYFYQYFLFRLMPHYEQAVNFRLEITHAFRISDLSHYLIVIALVIIIYLLTRKTDQKRGLFIIAFLLACIVVLNIQVITGWQLSPTHWMGRTNLFALNFAFFYLLYRLLIYLKIARHKYFIALIGILVAMVVSLVVGSVHTQYKYAKAYYKKYTIDKDFMASLLWLDEYMATDEVVLTPSIETNRFIPVHTRGRIYLPRAFTSVASNDEKMERLYIAIRLFDIDDDYIKDLLDCRKDSQGVKIYEGPGLSYFFAGQAMSTELDAYKKDLKDCYFPVEKYQKIFDDFEKFPEFNEEMLVKYRIDYLYVGPRERELIRRDIDSLPYFEKIFEAGEISIYVYADQHADLRRGATRGF